MNVRTPKQFVVDARAVTRHIEAICGLGDRFAGEPGDAAVADYVAGVFEELDLSLDRTPISVTGYREERCSVTLNGHQELEALTPYYTRGSETRIQAPGVFLGDDQRLDRYDVAGKVVVFEETDESFDFFWLGTLAEKAADAGAVGIITIHPLPWPYRQSMETGLADLQQRFADRSVPTVCVAAAGGMRLMRAFGAGKCDITLDVQTARPTVESDLVIGLQAGRGESLERIVLMAHRDFAIAPGANDNGSGIAAVLELARVLKDLDFDATIEYVSLPSEEGSAPGAAAYVEHLQASSAKVRAAINFDMLAVGGRLRLVEGAGWPNRKMRYHAPWLNALLDESAAELGYELGRLDLAWGVGDNGRLMEAGIPAAWFHKPDDYRYHSRHDKPEHVDGNAVKAAAEITALAVWRLASGLESGGHDH